ncbi:5-formyltetrahydrofolate cyclo-ligase [Clostridium sediminicola]|uniref:5-formyltetrahydrofolate cyclo-ligase n=1 Tax=Clostridium sediminicola TaxID=3114879 RepID=UPI003D186D47
MKAKNKLRKEMMNLRENINIEDKKIKDKIIFEKIIYDKTFLDAKSIFTFVSFKNEVNTHKLIKYSLAKGKSVYVPKVNSINKSMKAIKINSLDELKKSNYGILEPIAEANKFAEDKIDLIIVPGLAFDKNGGRLGYGGGYYDKFFQDGNMKAYKMGLAYSFQVVDQVPVNEYDVMLDGIVTD